MSGCVDPRRACGALAIVAALVAAVPCVDAVSRSLGGQAGEGAGIDSRAMAAREDAMSGLDLLEELASEHSDELPQGFAEEAGLPEGAHDVRVGPGGNVIGCLVDGGEEDAMGAVEAKLRDGGWTEVPLGAVGGATFVKDGGACNWVLVTCTQVGDETSVVFRGRFS